MDGGQKAVDRESRFIRVGIVITPNRLLAGLL